MTNIVAIKTKHPDQEKIAEQLESLAREIREGTNIGCAHILVIEGSGYWRNLIIGDASISMLIGYLTRCIHEYCEKAK